MAVDVQFTLKPYRVSEWGMPTWVLTQLELTQHAGKLLSTTVNVTREDLAQFRAGLHEVASGRRTHFEITTTDEDLLLQVSRDGRPQDVSFGFWTGEPYGLMSGFRFVAVATDLEAFARDLALDEAALVPPAGPP